jgi:hypothetical protein
MRVSWYLLDNMNWYFRAFVSYQDVLNIILTYLAFKYFGLKCTWWKLFQIRVVSIYFLINGYVCDNFIIDVLFDMLKLLCQCYIPVFIDLVNNKEPWPLRWCYLFMPIKNRYCISNSHLLKNRLSIYRNTQCQLMWSNLY